MEVCYVYFSFNGRWFRHLKTHAVFSIKPSHIKASLRCQEGKEDDMNLSREIIVEKQKEDD